MDKVIIDGIQYDLTGIEKDCWYRLLNGALQGRDPFHNPVVANSTTYGVNMRTVVLRKTLPVEKQLIFYTDTRSGKWEELKKQNSISWLFYDGKSRIQIRAGGVAALHHNDELADKAWANINTMNRKNYLSILIPSTESPTPVSSLPSELENNSITPGQSEAGRKNFGLVATKINWMEWLWLNNDGHRRANFIYGEDGNFTANWLVP